MEAKVSLFAVVLWGFNTGCWVTALFVDFYYKSTPEWLVVLYGATALMSLAAAVTNYARYKKQRDGLDERNQRSGGKKEERL